MDNFDYKKYVYNNPLLKELKDNGPEEKEFDAEFDALGAELAGAVKDELGDKAKNKIIEYVPHGINEKVFFPIREDHELYPKLQEFRSKTIPNSDIDFVVFFNSRNIHRKRPGDVIMAYRHF